MKPGRSKGDHFEILFPTSKAQVVTKTMYDKLKSKHNYTMKRSVKAKRGKRGKRGKGRTKVHKNTRRKNTMKRKTMKRKTMRRKTINHKRYHGGSPSVFSGQPAATPARDIYTYLTDNLKFDFLINDIQTIQDIVNILEQTNLPKNQWLTFIKGITFRDISSKDDIIQSIDFELYHTPILYE